MYKTFGFPFLIPVGRDKSHSVEVSIFLRWLGNFQIIIQWKNHNLPSYPQKEMQQVKIMRVFHNVEKWKT